MVSDRRREFTRGSARRRAHSSRSGASAAAAAAAAVGPGHGRPGAGLPYGEPTGCGSFVESQALSGHMGRRPYDPGFYHLLLDAKYAGEKIDPVGIDIFRPGQLHSHVDEIVVDDIALLVRLIREGGAALVIPRRRSGARSVQ